MNRKRTSELLTRSLGLFNEPSPEEMQSAGDRVHARLRVDSGKSQEGPAVIATSAPVLRKPLRLFVAAVAVGVIAIVAGSVLFWKGTLPRGSDPVTESTWSRVSMDQIEGSYAYHTDGRTGTTLVLPDDSRVEMRVRTELSFEHAADGLRILLKDGSILVSAAKQRTGHLYVQTKDMTVSVVGTVFLVKAEQQGSRVAVIEGEVRVQNGAITEKLLPGEQVATSTLMAARPVIEEIAWSPHAREHFAMLQQSALPPASVAGEARDTFDVVSIRPSVVPTGTGARGGGIAAGPGPCPQMNAFAMALQFDLDPSRLVIRRLPLYHLIGLAYGNSCPAPDSLTGGPDWATTELFDIEATIPAGSPSYTKGQLFSGNAPRLQRMLQSLLADRFKLVLKRQAKEMEGYNIIVALERRLKLSADQTPDQAPGAARGGRGLSGAPTIPLAAAPISRLATNLQQILHRPVVDKTGLTGLYDMWLEFPEIALPTAPPDGTTPSDIRAQGNRINERIQELLQSKLEATTGLKLEPAKVPVEVLEIVSAEKPSQN